MFGFTNSKLMQYRLVPFEEIDKNKWNGTVHYSPHGNAFGYHWYLRSVMKEWDAIIEGDYQSVMPIPRHQLSPFEWSLLGELGPYSVNAITASRCKEFFDMWQQSAPKQYYPFNNAWSFYLNQFSDGSLMQDKHTYVNMNGDYDTLYEKYSSGSQTILENHMKTDFTYQSFNKPEQFLENVKISGDERNTLYRLFYNAIQRGAGYHTRLTNNNTGKVADCFIISDQKHLYISYLKTNNDPATELKLLDTLIKSYSGRPLLLRVPKKIVSLWKPEHLDKNDYLYMPHLESTFIDRLKSLFKI